MSVYGMPGTKYIVRCKKGYQIRKRDKGGGKYRFYGFGKTLIIALMKLDWIKAHNWTRYPSYSTAKYAKPTGYGKWVIIKSYRKGDEKSWEYFGVYNSLEEVEKEVKILRECNWDFDAWVDATGEDGDFIGKKTKGHVFFEENENRYDGYDERIY